ncbi:MAG: hypothetical protein QNI87_00590 [Erythrobacter sp.]|uniref:hypothetical protein n=1 Tax=Erythrobacter sp. TaxID=1042 RepID=UPI00261432CD|nr:hypothetical protein [Erythrobacter sp.]MDJ0977013.1 hypothetical protein [Erythrobacter sp.]
MIPKSKRRCELLASAGLLALAAMASPASASASNAIDDSAPSNEAQAQPQSDPAPETTVQQAREREDPQTDFGTDSGGGPGTTLDDEDGGEIVVQGTRLRGQLDVEQAPLLELGEEDIAAEGVASISDLVQQIQNQTGSARGRGGGGRPVILVNGIRPGSFRELFQYPPEALAKVEVFPEEVAQRFGFPPDRRVINLILKENYASREVEFEFEGPARGGNLTTEQEFGYLKIADGGRFNFNFTAQDVSLLSEDERDIEQTPGSTSDLATDPDQAEFRSLIPDSRSLDANVSWAKAYLESGLSLSANANYVRADSRSLDGLNTVTLTNDLNDPDAAVTRTFGEEDPLERRTASDTISLAGSLTKPVNAFRLTSTLDTTFSESTTEIDNRLADEDIEALQEAALAGTLALDDPLPGTAENGFETAFSRNWTATNLNTVRGPLVDLPGGELLATFDIGYTWNRIESADTRTLDDVQLTRGNIQSGANFVIPITSRRNGFADALGSFTLNAQIGFEELSDFGTLGDYNVSLNWAPFDSLDLSATYIYREVAPALQSLGNPQITNLNVPVFDFVNGETVLADVTTGGNPDLPAETQRDWKFAVNWQLPFVEGTRFTVEYIRNRSDNVTSAFPQITEEIEAAFPDRVTRDANGTLVAIDQRPVSFDETRSDRLQFRLSARGSIGGGRRGFGGPSGGPGRAQGGPPSASRPPGAGGPPASARGGRGGFMAVRERVCADDGLETLKRIVEAVENGDDPSTIIPGVDVQRLEGFLSRVRNDVGEITDAALEQFRSRICSLDPSMFAGRGGRGGPGSPGQDPMVPQATTPTQGGEDPARAERLTALRARLCGENGQEEMRNLIAMIERGDDVSGILPGVDPSFLMMVIDRSRDADGNIPPQVLDRFRSRICSAEGPPGGGGAPVAGRPSTGGGARGGRTGAAGPAFNPLAGGGRRGWRYFANLTHTVELQNEIFIAPGVPVLDQLDGDATSAFGFPRHTSRLEAGIFGNGLGLRLSGRYTGETRLDGSETAGSGDLFFGDLATFDIRLFGNIDQLVGSQNRALKNLRVSLRMDNVFDAQLAVRDESGETPINYQPFLIDPVGRFIGIDIRKLF